MLSEEAPRPWIMGGTDSWSEALFCRTREFWSFSQNDGWRSIRTPELMLSCRDLGGKKAEKDSMTHVWNMFLE